MKKQYVYIKRKVSKWKAVFEVNGNKIQFICGDSWYMDCFDLTYYTEINKNFYVVRYYDKLPKRVLGAILLEAL